jgi:hypothetical protein
MPENFYFSDDNDEEEEWRKIFSAYRIFAYLIDLSSRQHFWGLFLGGVGEHFIHSD